MKTTHLLLGTLVLALATGAGYVQATDVKYSIKAPEMRKADFFVQLSGIEQTPRVTTDASGTAAFWVNGNHTAINFKLTVANLKHATMAHLHLGAAGSNGPAIAWLYRAVPTSNGLTSPENGVLSEGSFSASDLTGPATGMSITDLLDEIWRHGVYVNVHTQDYPEGEIRAQLP